jgi:hypothetical protein
MESVKGVRNIKNIKKHWSMKYKRSIDCNRPRGFSQKQHCKYGMSATERTVNKRSANKKSANKKRATIKKR